MTNKVIEIIDSNYYVELEKNSMIRNNLSYLVSFMIKNDMTNLEQYAKYSDELLNAIANYNTAKSKFENNVIKSKLKSNEKLLT